VTISTDIDSVIYVTHELHISGIMKILTGPLKKAKAPINHHNHVYVKILPPPTEYQQSMGIHRTDWESQRTPLSRIPNTHFGEIGDFKVAIFFPRLMHQDDTNRRRWITRVPDVVHALFVEMVLYPALRKVGMKHQNAYWSHSPNDVRNRDGPNDTNTGKAYPVNNSQLIDLQGYIDYFIAQDAELAMFGSWFLVGDIRGCKQYTTVSTEHRAKGSKSTAWDALRNQYPALHWNHMLNPGNGALHLDLGVGIHPDDEDTAYVGVWRLDRLRESYDYGGFLSGRVHHAAQMLNCGGMQAEMSKSMEWATHVNFRSSYNLSFEVVRRDGGRPVYYCKDGDAYSGNRTYLQCMEKKIKLFRKAREKGFGVRDETRASGLAVRSMLEGAIEKAYAFLESDPIVWIPSRVWFGMLERRYRAIRATQLQLLRRDPLPSNLGILSAVLMHMVRAATITPIVMKAYLTHALQDLHQAEQMEMWGMFMIKCLDLRNDNIMPLVEGEDDDQVLRDCGGAVARKNIAQRRMERFMRKKGQVTPEFPLGENPTWEELNSAVKNKPEVVMREWVWNPVYDGHADAARLFVKMSRHIWFQAFEQDHFRAPSIPRIICLEDAMKAWSVRAIFASVLRPSFLASNADIEGATRQGKASASFVSLRKNLLFFPPTAEIKATSRWKTLMDYGYIRDYHRYLGEHGEEHIAALHDAIDYIFNHIHCLPCSTDMKIWQASKDTYGPIFRTNPAFYKIRGLRKGARTKET
ncbi:hypothetical protein BD410DRAFT_699596, partial [Rickenella mellea]